MTVSWKMAWPMIIFHILVVINGAFFPAGLRSRISGVGGSVARARAANVSMIKLTHRSWTAVRTEVISALETEETKVRSTAVILTVIWNYGTEWSVEVKEESCATYLEELADGVVDSATPHQSLNDRGKVVIH